MGRLVQQRKAEIAPSGRPGASVFGNPSSTRRLGARSIPLRSAAKPQPNGVRPSSGAETSDGNTCGSNPEPQTSLKLLRPGTAALRKFIAACEQFPPLQCKPVRFLSHSQR